MVTARIRHAYTRFNQNLHKHTQTHSASANYSNQYMIYARKPLISTPLGLCMCGLSIIYGLSGCIRVRFVRTQEPIQVHTCTSYTYAYKKETNVPLYGLGGLILQLPHRIIRPLLLPPTTPLRHLLRTHRLTGRPANIRTFSLLSYVDI